MRCLIGTIGLEDYSLYSYGEIFEVQESLANDFERDKVAERIIEHVKETKEPKQKAKKE